jgi:hypothetical protein
MGEYYIDLTRIRRRIGLILFSKQKRKIISFFSFFFFLFLPNKNSQKYPNRNLFISKGIKIQSKKMSHSSGPVYNRRNKQRFGHYKQKQTIDIKKKERHLTGQLRPKTVNSPTLIFKY